MAEWLGGQLYVLDTWSDTGGLAVYHPATRRWTSLPPANFRPSIVTLSGGRIYGFAPGGAAVFDTGTGRWRSIAHPGIQPDVAVDLGGQPLVWDGFDAAVYDPATNAWSRAPELPLSRRSQAATGVVGGRFVVWGGWKLDHDPHRQESDVSPYIGSLHDGAEYDPVTNRWTRIDDGPLSARYAPGSRGAAPGLFVWGGSTSDQDAVPPADDGALLTLPGS